jgi:hypothetical protein
VGDDPGLADHLLPAALRVRHHPVEWIRSVLRRGWLSNVACSTPEHLVQHIRLGLRHIQYRSHLAVGFLAETGLTTRAA